MGLTKWIVDFCANLINGLGYGGIFILMTCESMYFPIPSFAVMPFVGFVAHRTLDSGGDGLSFWPGVLAGLLGGLAGSLLTYYFGYWAGPKGVKKWGRYVALVPEDLDATQAWFDKRGAIAVFTGRFIPVVRHFISTVAGIAHMRLVPFLLMTTAGAFLWDLFLAYLGWVLQEQYGKIHEWQKPLDALVIVVFGGGGVWIVLKLRARIRARKAANAKDVVAPPTSPAA